MNKTYYKIRLITVVFNPVAKMQYEILNNNKTFKKFPKDSFNSENKIQKTFLH